MSKSQNDNRRHPRFILVLPIQISTKDFTVNTTSRNISCSGLLCEIDRFIPLNTDIEVSMKLAYQEGEKKINKTVKCKARIARIEKQRSDEDESCQVGIAFEDIQEEDKYILKEYIHKKNLKEAKELKKIYLRLKEMAARLVEVEECHPTAEHFRKVINKAIVELDSAAHILDFEINELKNLE
jgi:hypothetical protein